MSVLQNLRMFVDSRLYNCIKWSENVKVEEQHTGSDQAAIVITTRANRFGLKIVSSYSHPPLGALKLVHLSEDNHEINGSATDTTWNEISAYIHEKEGQSPHTSGRRAVASEVTPLAPRYDGPLPGVGDTVLYVGNPGEHSAGVSECMAQVTRTNPERGTIDLWVQPPGAEGFHRENVTRKGAMKHVVWEIRETLSPGAVVHINDAAKTDALIAQVAALSDRLESAEAALAAVQKPKGKKAA